MLTEEMTMTYEESVKYLYKIAGFATKSSLEDIKILFRTIGKSLKRAAYDPCSRDEWKRIRLCILEALPYPAWKEDGFLYLATCCEDQ